MTPTDSLRQWEPNLASPVFARSWGVFYPRAVNTKPLAVYLGGLALMLLTLIGVAVYQAEQIEERRSRPEYQQRLREYLEVQTLNTVPRGGRPARPRTSRTRETPSVARLSASKPWACGSPARPERHLGRSVFVVGLGRTVPRRRDAMGVALYARVSTDDRHVENQPIDATGRPSPARARNAITDFGVPDCSQPRG